MTMQRTPGPWSIEHDWFELIHVLDAEERIIATLEKHNNDHAKRQRANAALIRAAPEMLAALRRIAASVEHQGNCPTPDGHEHCAALARAAIAGAKGR